MWKALAAFMLIGVVAGRVNRQYNEERLREGIEEQCKQYGAEEHVEEVMQGLTNFTNCFFSVVDREAIARLANQGPDFSLDLLNFVKTNCKSQDKINQCFLTLYQAMLPCIDPEDRDDMDKAKKDLADMSDLFCKDNSKAFTEFILDGAMSCLYDNVNNILACTHKLMILQNYKTVTTAEACEEVNEMSSCIIQTLNRCPKPSTAQFVTEFFRVAERSSKCVSHEKKLATNTV